MRFVPRHARRGGSLERDSASGLRTRGECVGTGRMGLGEPGWGCREVAPESGELWGRWRKERWAWRGPSFTRRVPGTARGDEVSPTTSVRTEGTLAVRGTRLRASHPVPHAAEYRDSVGGRWLRWRSPTLLFPGAATTHRTPVFHGTGFTRQGASLHAGHGCFNPWPQA